MTRAAFNRRYDLVRHLAGPQAPRWLPIPPPIPELKEHKKAVRDRPTRPSHLKASRFVPSPHPLTRISKALPHKLPTMAELEAMSHEELARRFLLTSRKFPCRPSII